MSYVLCRYELQMQFGRSIELYSSHIVCRRLAIVQICHISIGFFGVVVHHQSNSCANIFLPSNVHAGQPRTDLLAQFQPYGNNYPKSNKLFTVGRSSRFCVNANRDGVLQSVSWLRRQHHIRCVAGRFGIQSLVYFTN